ncbi:hypothetical protein [Winogradskyella sp. 3972H.M.0a.05]|uniref:O-antigen ligase family protein n=1 Tax=Winogradskyella sp. 3972H.M.0a.05 TaxID=2950277 RepID=UPI0033950B6B
MIIIPLIIILVIFLIRIQKGMFAALLLVVATKSIIDAFWEYRVGPLSFSSFGGIIIPLIFFPVLKKQKIFPNFWKKNSYLLLAALSLGFIFALPIKPLETIELMLIVINIFFAFYIIPYLVRDSKKLKQLLLAIIISGVFPIVVSLYQFQTGVVFQERETVGLTRYVGFYHDAFPVRFYGLFTLFSIIAFFHLFKPKNKIFSYGLMLVGLGALFSVYLVFSKAAVAIIGLWVILILIFSRLRFRAAFTIMAVVIVLGLVFGDTLFSNIEQLFSKEVGYQTGEIKDARFTLAGRGYIWQDYWQFWATEQATLFQWFGDGIGRPSHNEYFRILLLNGIVGLFFFLVYLFSTVKIVFKSNKKVKVLCFMLMGMYLIDCIGLDTGYYYYYNILLWGIIGLFVTRKESFFYQS